MDVFLASLWSATKITKEIMDCYLAGESPTKSGKLANWDNLFVLESFFYARQNKYIPRLIANFGKFLLDSGAFTYLQKSNTEVDWEKYIEDYAEFINKYDIEHFFELDIDSLVGLKKVELLRAKLEDLTGKKCIPVWHKNRGKEYFIEMCKNYPYVAIGGIVTQEIPRKRYEALFPWFIKTAHQYGVKIHGLGYTNQEGMRKYKFDSVDSTAWIYGNCSGCIYKFSAATGYIQKIQAPQGKRLKSKETRTHNFNEWVKFQKWARYNL
jgi:hypothetical protein